MTEIQMHSHSTRFIVTPHPAIQWNFRTLLLCAYPLLCPLLVIPANTLLSASDLLFVPAALVIMATGQFRWPRLEQACFGLFLASCVGSVFAVGDAAVARDSLLKCGRLLAIVLPLYLVLFVDLPQSLGQKILRLFETSALIAILIGFVLHYFQYEIPGGANQRIWTNGKLMLRAGGLYGNTTYFGQVVAFWTVLRMGRLIQQLEDKATIWKILFTISIAAYGIYASSSRAALLATATGLIVVLALNYRRIMNLSSEGLFYIMSSVAACTVSGLTLLAATGSDITDRTAWEDRLNRFSLSQIEERGLKTATSGRTEIWSTFIENLTDSDAWMGIGYGCSDIKFDTDAHNGMLTVLVETGIPGLVSMLLFVTAVFYRLYCNYRAGCQFSKLTLPVMVSVITASLTGTVFHTWATMPVIYLIIGIASSATSLPSPASAGWNEA